MKEFEVVTYERWAKSYVVKAASVEEAKRLARSLAETRAEPDIFEYTDTLDKVEVIDNESGSFVE